MSEAGGLTEEEVRWGFRLLAGREPVNEVEFAAFKALPTLDAMRQAFTNTPEFHNFFSAIMTGHPSWAPPLFLLRPPAVPGLDWRFAAPDLDRPTSQLCTAAQLREPAFQEIAEAMAVTTPAGRALWDQVWIVAVLATEGLIEPGRIALALAPERERVAALLASRGVQVRATMPEGLPSAKVEAQRSRLFYPEIIDLDYFDRLIEALPIDPAAVGRMPAGGYDACWSVNMPQRLGSVAAGLDAFEASLAPLRPGGLALHTFLLNLTTDGFTWDVPELVILRRRDVEALAERLMARGHRLLCLNTHPGHEEADERTQLDPAAPPGLRVRYGTIVAGTFGLAIRKAG
jgi:hypothetical protein